MTENTKIINQKERKRMEIKSLHTHVDIVARSKGASVIAKAAYNARDKLQDEYYGKTHDYSKKTDLVFSKIFLPEHIPKEFSNREYLWNEVEKIEKSKNSQLARNLLFELPRELNEQERIKLISEFIEENFTSKGMIADCNIHNPMASDHEEQPHAHILLTLREMDSEGKWKPKCRKEYILDENGEKIKLKSGNYKSRKVNLNDWNEPDKAKEWRENFSKKANEYLARNNIQKRIDPRTFEEQGREELPQIHLGTSSYQMEKKGIQTERGNQNRKIIALNLEFRKLKEELSKLTSWIGSLLGSLQVKYDEYKQEKKEEYENKAEFFNLYEYISIYYDLQGEKARKLNFESRFKDAWIIFKSLMEAEGNPCFEHRMVLSDAGRSALSGSTDYASDVLLFENRLEFYEKKSANHSDYAVQKYMYAFYAARLRLKMGGKENTEKALLLFKKAKTYPPQSYDYDVALWYILDIEKNRSFKVFLEELCSSAPSWKNPSVYEELTAHACMKLVLSRDWKGLEKLQKAVQKTNLLK